MSAHTQQADQERPCGRTGTVGGTRTAERSRTRSGHFVDFLQIFLGRIYCISKLQYRLKHHLNEKGFLISKTIRILRIDVREAKEI